MALDDKHLVVSILSSYFVLTAFDELEGIFFSLGFISLKTAVVIIRLGYNVEIGLPSFI